MQQIDQVCQTRTYDKTEICNAEHSVSQCAVDRIRYNGYTDMWRYSDENGAVEAQ